jgi:hypothetical protein
MLLTVLQVYVGLQFVWSYCDVRIIISAIYFCIQFTIFSTQFQASLSSLWDILGLFYPLQIRFVLLFSGYPVFQGSTDTVKDFACMPGRQV